MKWLTGDPIVKPVAMPLDAREIPFYYEIEKIYRGYRQCYSKKPFVDKEFTSADYDQLYLQLHTYMEDKLIASKIHKDEETRKQINKANVEALVERYGKEKYLQFFHKCKFIKDHMNHESQLEHGTFTVQITDIDRSTSHQIVRHRLSSIGHQSQRYVSESDPDILVPHTIRDNDKAYETFQAYLSQLPAVIERLKKLGIPTEDIRSVFPNAIKTEMIMSNNLRQWVHIFEERCCMRAQTPIRKVAKAVLSFLQHNIPYVFDDLGAKCKRLGYCPEAQCCGRMPKKSDVIK